MSKYDCEHNWGHWEWCEAKVKYVRYCDWCKSPDFADELLTTWQAKNIYAAMVCLWCRRGKEIRREPGGIAAWLHYHDGEPAGTCAAEKIHEYDYQGKTATEA